MLPVSHSFRLRYLDCNLAPAFAECDPVVEVFFDAHFERSRETGGVLDIALDEKDLSKTYEGTIQAKLSRRVGKIPPTACIGLASWVIHRNEQGFMCFVDAGTAHIQIGEMMRGMESSRDGTWSKELELVMHTTTPVFGGEQPIVIKGKLEFTATKLDLGKVQIDTNAPLLMRMPIEKRDSLLIEYVQRCMKLETQMKDTIPGTSRVRAPMDISESGIELTGNMFLPVAAYSLFEVPESDLSYWKNAFQLVMKRQNLRMADYHHMDKVQKARTMALIVTLQAQTFDYVGDEVDRNTRHAQYQARLKQGFENFGDALVTFSGDCEDTATVIQQNLRSFQSFQFPSTEKELKEMQNISRQYMPLLTLAVVHGAKADDENAPKGAHMYVSLLTMAQVKRALNKTSEGRAVLANAPWDATIMQNVDDELPTLFGEGTGKIDPLGYHDPNLDKRQYLYQAASLQSFKKELPHERGAASGFYLGNMMGITSEFVRKGGNMAGFIFGTKVGDTITRGTYWTDVINQAETMVLVPQPPIPKPIMEIMREATCLRVPTRGLFLDKTKASGLGQEHHPLLENLAQEVQSFGRSNPPLNAQQSIDVFVRPHQLTGPIVQRIISDMRSMPKVYKVDYQLEQITTQEHQWRIQFFID